MRRFNLMTLAVPLLAGCAQLPKEPAPDPAFAVLNRAASEIQDSWALIGAMEKGRGAMEGQQIAPEAIALGPKLSRRVTLRWSGDLQPVLELLAADAGIPLRITGKRSAHPIQPVFVEVHEARIGDVIRDIGYQAAGSVEIVLTAVVGQESVELIYARRKQ